MNHFSVIVLLSLIVFVTAQTSGRFGETFPEIRCGDVFPYKCRNSRYRNIDGSCNNLRRPQWGMPFTRYARLAPAYYADGYFEPRVAKSGNPLPLARVLSRVLSPDRRMLDKKYSLAAMEYTHIITHDVQLSDTFVEAPDNQCCSKDGKVERDPAQYPLCYPPIVPEDDPDFSSDGIRCLNSFIRKRTDVHRGCVALNGSANQMSMVTHLLDLSLIYGNHEDQLARLREFRGGRLIVVKRQGRDWPPNDNTCSSESQQCYKTGDRRANLSFQLILYQIAFVRQHNRFANGLSKINPHWNDERIFQEARRIMIAMHQHITYYEWMPQFLGVQNSLWNKLIYNTTNYVNDYNPAVDPSTYNEVVAAAFRAFHSILAAGSIAVNENRDPPVKRYTLNGQFNNPGIIEEDDNFDSLIRGLATQPQEQCDQYFPEELTKYLSFGPDKVRSDTRALDIHRGRDQGLAPYNEYRRICGFPKARKWDDFLDFISAENVDAMSRLYESPDDVDLMLGAMLEVLAPGALLGPTFLCITTRQFYKTRVADRFFYENGRSGNPFTLDQLNEIRKSSSSRFICDTTGIRKIQARSMELISDTNPLVDCKTLPSINLARWKEN